jgi:hypothetical protein
VVDHCGCGLSFIRAGETLTEDMEDVVLLGSAAEKLEHIANALQERVVGTETVGVRARSHAVDGYQLAAMLHESTHDGSVNAPPRQLRDAWSNMALEMIQMMTNHLIQIKRIT